MNGTLSFFVAGHPKTKGSLDPINLQPGRKPHLAESVDPEGIWRTSVALAACEAGRGRRPEVTSYRHLTAEMKAPAIVGKDRAVAVALTFFIPAPKSAVATADGPVRHGTGDLDKLTRCVLDALQDAGVLPDDACVSRVVAAKEWALPEFGDVPGCFVSVKAIPLRSRSVVSEWVSRCWKALVG